MGLGDIGSGIDLTDAEVWAYVARTLTDPNSYKADVSALALEASLLTVAEYIDTEIGTLLTRIPATMPSLAHFDLAQFEICQVPIAENDAVAVSVTTADQSLGAKDITLDIPAGATIISVIAMAKVNIMNNSANAQKIDLKFDVEGTTLFDQDDIVGFGDTDGTSAVYLIAEDASGEVTADAQVVTLEAFCTLSSANSVRFQAQYFLFTVYKMG